LPLGETTLQVPVGRLRANCKAECHLPPNQPLVKTSSCRTDTWKNLQVANCPLPIVASANCQVVKLRLCFFTLL